MLQRLIHAIFIMNIVKNNWCSDPSTFSSFSREFWLTLFPRVRSFARSFSTSSWTEITFHHFCWIKILDIEFFGCSWNVKISWAYFFGLLSHTHAKQLNYLFIWSFKTMKNLAMAWKLPKQDQIWTLKMAKLFFRQIWSHWLLITFVSLTAFSSRARPLVRCGQHLSKRTF